MYTCWPNCLYSSISLQIDLQIAVRELGLSKASPSIKSSPNLSSPASLDALHMGKDYLVQLRGLGDDFTKLAEFSSFGLESSASMAKMTRLGCMAGQYKRLLTQIVY